MILHADPKLFSQAIRATSQYLKINPEFVEKDYWITLVLKQLSKSDSKSRIVFKGGTSLAKGYQLINRFSEDVDLAIISKFSDTGNQVKNLIRKVEKEITEGLTEIFAEGITSKGSRFRKSLYQYPTFNAGNKANRIIVEINSFANPFPYQELKIENLVAQYFEESGNENLIAEYELEGITLNVLDKNQTLVEKMVSLIRSSFDKDNIEGIKSKIRHFYDLHYLLQNEECHQFVMSGDFENEFAKIFEHDKQLFDEPHGWGDKTINDSILAKNYDSVWGQIKNHYKVELSALAFTEIPPEEDVINSFKTIMDRLKAQ